MTYISSFFGKMVLVCWMVVNDEGGGMTMMITIIATPKRCLAGER